MISLKNTLEAIKTKLSAHDKALSVDYIVEQGTSGIWTYRKWNSGIAECWYEGIKTINFSYNIGGSGVWATTWDGTGEYKLPSFVTSVKCVTANAMDRDANWSTNLSARVDGSQIIVNPMAFSSGGQRSHKIDIYVIGKWK